jgi:hypothetical protein
MKDEEILRPMKKLIVLRVTEQKQDHIFITTSFARMWIKVEGDYGKDVLTKLKAKKRYRNCPQEALRIDHIYPEGNSAHFQLSEHNGKWGFVSVSSDYLQPLTGLAAKRI